MDALDGLRGMIMGDGTIYRSRGSFVLRIKHAARQRAYLENKASVINAYLGREVTVTDIRNNGYPGCVYGTTSPKFEPLWEMFYSGGSKNAADQFLSALTVRDLAYWWFDDGSLYPSLRNGKPHAWQGVLSTYCDEEQATRIASSIRDRFGVDFHLNRGKGKFRLFANTAQCRALSALLLPYAPPSMLYKVTLQRPL